MSLNIPTDEIRQAGAGLSDLSAKMASLSNRASSINGAVAACYMQGGIGAKVADVAGQMVTLSQYISDKGQALASGAQIYEQKEEALYGSAVKVAGKISGGYDVDWLDRPEIGGIVSDSVAVAAENTVSKVSLLDRIGDCAQIVRGKVQSIAAELSENYKNHGSVYDVVQYGKCALRIAKAGVKIVGALGDIATGVGIPIAILKIVSAGNDIINGVNDAKYVYTDQYEMVGTQNYLKDLLKEKGGDLGEMLGNREAGEIFGEATYAGIDAVTFLDSVDGMLKSYGKVHTDLTESTGYSFVWGETHFEDIMDNEIDWTSTSGIIRNILGVHANSTGNFVYEAVEKTVKAYKKGGKLISDFKDLIVR